MSTPNATIASAQPRRVSLRSILLLVAGLLPALGAATALYLIVPYYRTLYASLGVELPLATRWLLDGYQAAAALPLAVVALWLLWPRRGHGEVAAALLGAIGAALVLGLAWWAVHLPLAPLCCDV